MHTKDEADDHTNSWKHDISGTNSDGQKLGRIRTTTHHGTHFHCCYPKLADLVSTNCSSFGLARKWYDAFVEGLVVSRFKHTLVKVGGPNGTMRRWRRHFQGGFRVMRKRGRLFARRAEPERRSRYPYATKRWRWLSWWIFLMIVACRGQKKT